MDDLFWIFFWLFVVVTVITVVGHIIWLMVAHLIRLFFPKDETTVLFQPGPTRCRNCETRESLGPFGDLAITERQITLFFERKDIDAQLFEFLKGKIQTERERLRTPEPKTTSQPIPEPVVQPVSKPVVPVFRPAQEEPVSEPVVVVQPAPRPRRRTFTEVLNAFMEESNIRWGEIIGGLLIIGCSTALVVSLWAQISEVPVLKFLIFTTVTAVLFGIGLYTEHRWKLPTTSRGILTIATLLVPLNFLAIAAVSLSGSADVLIVTSEIAAPAVFLCLIYFAGRVITPRCAHLLSAGVLSSSVGQLLVRHFAVDASPFVMVLLGAFPVCCYVIATGLALRVVLADREITEDETTSVFTMLGIMSFASLLPFGLLLYRSGPLSWSMMYLAPVVTLWGVPMLAVGSALWSRIKQPQLVASRIAGSSLAILGVVVVLLGVILAWPNPSSIVPAALLNVAVFTALAVLFELPLAHGLAAACFALAYLVLFHVAGGNISWQNLRVASLLQTCLSVSSGQILTGLFALFVVVSEWLCARGREVEGRVYRYAAWSIAVVSVVCITVFGWWSVDYHHLWLVYAFFAAAAYVFAVRLRKETLSWVGSFLLLVAFADLFARELYFSFPWQTALLVLATLTGSAAIFVKRESLRRSLNYASLVSLLFAVASFFQTNPWQVTSMQAVRLFWISAILGVAVWLNRRQVLLHALQIALTVASMLTVKGALQQFDWYSYQPHAFLHPVALEIYGTVLVFLSLGWLGVRTLCKRIASLEPVLTAKYAVDRILLWGLIPAFLLLVSYGSFSGIIQEVGAIRSDFPGINVAGFPHLDAVGPGAWILLGLLSVAMLVTYWQRRRAAYLYGTIALLAGLVPLISTRFESQLAVASATRWFAAIFLLAGSVLIWMRTRVARLLTLLGVPRLESQHESFPTVARLLLLSLAVTPILILTGLAALRAVNHVPVQSPVSGFFFWQGNAFSYGIPLVITALVCIGYALRERLPDYAFYAGVCLNATVTLAYLLSVVAGHGPMDREVLINVIQLNGITFAAYMLPWLATRHLWTRPLTAIEHAGAQSLLKITLWLAMVCNLVLIISAASVLMLTQATFAVGGGLTWLNFALTSIAAAWWITTREKRTNGAVLVAWLSLLACLASFSVLDVSGLLAGRTLALALAIVATLSVLLPYLVKRENVVARFFDLENPRSRIRVWAAFVGGLAAVLSLRFLNFPDNAWSIATLLSLTPFFVVLNWQSLRRRYLYLAAVTFHLAVSLWRLQLNHNPPLADFLNVNFIAGSVIGIAWLLLELRARRLRTQPVNHFFSVHLTGGMFALVLFAEVTVFTLFLGAPSLMNPALTWTALVTLILFQLACLWDKSAKPSLVALYALGLLAGVIGLDQLNVSAERFVWAWSIYLALFTVFATLLWQQRARLFVVARQLKIPRRIHGKHDVLPWLAVATTMSVTAVFAITDWIVLDVVELELRVTAAVAFASLAVAFALLATGSWRLRWQRASVGVVVTGATLIGWSFLNPAINGTWLNRSVILMLVAFGLTALYSLSLRSFSVSWSNAIKSLVPFVLGAGLFALCFCLSTEVFYQLSFGVVRIHPVSLVAIGITLVAAVVISLLFALSPQHDPLTLPARDRVSYVYAAEAMLALLFLHVRLTMPWLFTGVVERYWPLVVMAIAYLGVVASEALRRRELFVLARPLERTGTFLPLLPVLGFWLATSQVDFSLLLFVVGGLYGLLAVLRRSFLCGVLAALAGHGAFWYVLQRTDDYQFFQHPQLWLIPVALSVLVAAYLNKARLSDEQFTGVRYLSLVTVYVSSTADIFINGVVTSPWLPLVLASLSLAGAFSGILFRVRGMLLMGSVFLLLSIVTMIWYGAENLGWTWLWYVAGIATGATIIFMFAVFEKKRSEVLRLVEGLKEWDH